jgi:hypothetical protein
VFIRLEGSGPTWSFPGITDILKQLPFMDDLPEPLLLWLRAMGEIRSYSAGQCIIPPRVRRLRV